MFMKKLFLIPFLLFATTLFSAEEMIVYEGECAICLGETNPQQDLILSCGHVFHIDCVNEWFKRRLTCPKCSQPVVFTIESEQFIISIYPVIFDGETFQTTLSGINFEELSFETRVFLYHQSKNKTLNFIKITNRSHEPIQIKLDDTALSKDRRFRCINKNIIDTTRIRKKYPHSITHAGNLFSKYFYPFLIVSIFLVFLSSSEIQEWIYNHTAFPAAIYFGLAAGVEYLYSEELGKHFMNKNLQNQALREMTAYLETKNFKLISPGSVVQLNPGQEVFCLAVVNQKDLAKIWQT